MQWRGRRTSTNVQDRRGARRVGVVGAGGGIGTIVILGLMYWMSGGDPQVLIDSGVLQHQGAATGSSEIAPNDDASTFVKVVLADTEDVWRDLFRKAGTNYVEPKLVLFRGQVDSACGFTSAAVGPFYCPLDQIVYLDLDFFDELQRRLNAPGDFAEAYVIAHEVGHHVQKLMGLGDKVHEQERRTNKIDANRLSVRIELQADYLAGVWAHFEQQSNVLDPKDIQEALRAASAVGDDQLQKQAQGRVIPDSFTHGTSAQRLKWFKRGYESGSLAGAGELFKVAYEEL